jgi:phytoene synthase
VVGLYALNHELARATEAAHEPLVQEIRLTWWREALDEVFAAKPVRRHPVVEALAQTIRRRDLPAAPFEAMIEARIAAIDAARLASEDEVYAHIDATAGALMGLAASALAAAAVSDGTRSAARAWGLAGLLRLRRAGVDRLPQAWDEADVRSRVRSALAEAGRAVRGMPVAAFPAMAYATLAGAYAARRAPSDLEKRLRLTAAVLTGRL